MTLILLPIGSCEQHGPHLPVDTDTRIAVAVANLAAARIGSSRLAWVAPALAFGASWEHHGFDGLLSINDTLLHDILVEMARSADWASGGIVLVNGHGGNVPTVQRAVQSIRAEGRHALGWAPRLPDGGDAHAGHSETSAMLAIAPELVDLARAERGFVGPVERRAVRELSQNGVLGDPAGATAEVGAALLDQWATSLGAAVERWLEDRHG